MPSSSCYFTQCLCKEQQGKKILILFCSCFRWSSVRYGLHLGSIPLSIYSMFSFHIFFNTHLGYPLNFLFSFHHYVTGAYLCLAEVKWVKTGVPRVKPLLGVKGFVSWVKWGPSTLQVGAVFSATSVGIQLRTYPNLHRSQGGLEICYLIIFNALLSF